MKKGELHIRNIHRGKYNFKKLTMETTELKKYIRKNPNGEDTIDFSSNEAVICLNKALLKTYYNIDFWGIPKGFLCPPIPGRADYIHYISDLFDDKKGLKVLDIGTGANCIYPILGTQLYEWSFVASDIDPKSIENANKIVESNKVLKGKIELRLQENKNNIFSGIIKKDEIYDITLCNPPFHSSLKNALDANKRKVNNLSKGNKEIRKGLNFGGQKAELWCPGGEIAFLKKMVKESEKVKLQVKYFTTLISNKDNVRPLIKMLEKMGAKSKIIRMTQGQKISRVLVWTYKKGL